MTEIRDSFLSKILWSLYSCINRVFLLHCSSHKRMRVHSKEVGSYKNFATLTAMALEEFDSLDEDDMNDADSEDETDAPQNTIEPINSSPNRTPLDHRFEQTEFSEAPEPAVPSSSISPQIGSCSPPLPLRTSPLTTKDPHQVLHPSTSDDLIPSESAVSVAPDATPNLIESGKYFRPNCFHIRCAFTFRLWFFAFIVQSITSKVTNINWKAEIKSSARCLGAIPLAHRNQLFNCYYS